MVFDEGGIFIVPHQLQRETSIVCDLIRDVRQANRYGGAVLTWIPTGSLKRRIQKVKKDDYFKKKYPSYTYKMHPLCTYNSVTKL
jgi:hypothetical protein